MHKLLGINGSPKKNGNTAFLLNACLESAENEGIETGILHLADYAIRQCDACDRCVREKKCHIKDDFEKIEKKMIEADALVLASPIHLAYVSGLMKDFGDRVRPLRFDSFKLKDKFASFICFAGLRRGGQEHAFLWFVNFCLYYGLVPIGNASNPAGSAYFPTGSLQRDNGGFGGVKDDALAVEEARQLGKRLAEALKKFKVGKK